MPCDSQQCTRNCLKSWLTSLCMVIHPLRSLYAKGKGLTIFIFVFSRIKSYLICYSNPKVQMKSGSHIETIRLPFVLCVLNYQRAETHLLTLPAGMCLHCSLRSMTVLSSSASTFPKSLSEKRTREILIPPCCLKQRG